MELNPNHPVASALHNNWHKIVAIIMQKMNKPEILITMDELEDLLQKEMYITAQEDFEGLHIKLVDRDTAYKLMAMEEGTGGLQ